MPISGTKQNFTEQNIEKAPDQPGVYGLYDATGNTIYYGSSDASIKSRLKSHKSGMEGSGTQTANTFNCELSAKPLDREKELLNEHKRQLGKLPKFNEVTS